MKIINMPRGFGKTVAMAKWVLQDVDKRAVLIGYQANKQQLLRLDVPEENIILAGTFDSNRVKDFKEIGIDEANKTLSVLLGVEVGIIAGTMGNSEEG